MNPEKDNSAFGGNSVSSEKGLEFVDTSKAENSRTS